MEDPKSAPVADPVTGAIEDSPSTGSSGPSDRVLSVAATGVVAAATLVTLVFGLRLGLVLDDIALYGLANREQIWNPSYLLINWQGHLQPLGIAFSWLAARAFGLDSFGYSLLAAAGAAWALWLVFTLSRRVVGKSWLALVPVLLLATSYAVLGATVWWSNALLTTPLMIISLLSVRRMIPGQEGGKDPVPTLLGLQLLALLFCERAVLIPLLLFSVAVAWEPARLGASIRSVWMRWRTLWLAEAAILAVYVSLYLLRGNPTGTPGLTTIGAAQLGKLPSHLGHGLGQALPTSFFGGPIATIVPITALPPDWFQTFAIVTFAAMVVAGLIVSRRSRRMQIIALGYAALTITGLVLGGRAVAWGGLFVWQLRYYAEAAVWLAIALAATLAAVRLRSRSWQPTGRRLAAVGLCLLILVSAVCWTVTLRNLWRQAGEITAAPANAPWRSYLKAADKLPAGSQLLNLPADEVPLDLIASLTGRPLSQSEAYGRLLPNIDYTDGPATLIRYLPDQGGFYATDVVGPSATPKPPACVTPANPTTTVTLTSRLYRLRHFVHATGTGPASSQIRVQLDDAPGGTLRLGGNQTTSYTWVTGETDTVTLTLENGPGACITTLTIGPAEPRQRLTP